jgi:hypothetical protein
MPPVVAGSAERPQVPHRISAAFGSRGAVINDPPRLTAFGAAASIALEHRDPQLLP